MSDSSPPMRRLSPVWWLFGAFVVFILFRETRVPDNAQARYCAEGQPPAAGRVVMLSATWCRYCTKTRNWLVAHHIDYCEYDIERSATGAGRYARGAVKVVPQIFIGDRLIVGFNADELEQTLAAHDLMPTPGE